MDIALTESIINTVKEEVVALVSELLKDDLVQIVLYGSCARGDYNADSDIDIAIITKSGRLQAKSYASDLANIATVLAMKYFAVVNFVCLPYAEFEEKKGWYAYFRNIDTEGVVLYG